MVELYKSNSCYLQQDDDGFILYESRAMCRYIARKYASQGTPLIPTELKAEALFEQAASIETSYFKHAAAAVAEGVSKKYAVISVSSGCFSKQIIIHSRYRGLEPDQAVLEGHLRELRAKMDVYDKILSKQKYLGGDVRTPYIIPHATILSFTCRSSLLQTFFTCRMVANSIRPVSSGNPRGPM